jgi:hypothetical protein
LNPDELARLEADLAAIEARLADSTFTAKNSHQRLAEERQFRDNLRARIESERARIAAARPVVAGGLPSRSTGQWQPLPLHERPQVETEEGALPLAPLSAPEQEEPDRQAIAEELTRMLSSYSGKIATFAERWIHDLQLRPLLVAAVQARGFKKAALELDPFGKPFVVPRQRENVIPPTPFLNMAAELPDEFTGLTVLQRLVLEVLRTSAPHTGPFVRLSVIATDVAHRQPGLREGQVEHVLIALGHPSLRRLPLVEFQGFTGRFDPHGTHCTHARLTRVGFEVLEETFPLPLVLVNGAEGHGACLPPHSPRELARAALLTLEHSNTTFATLSGTIEGPDFPDGGVLLHHGIRELCHGGEATLRTRAQMRLEHGPQGHVRVVLSELPWPMTGESLRSAVLELEKEGALRGFVSVEDQSSATGGRVVIEFEHLAYSWLATEAIVTSRIHELHWRAALHVRSGQYARRLSLADLMSAFIEHRKEVAVKRLDQAVAQARVRARGAEALWLALSLLEPVLAVMREALDDAEAVNGLMNFMRPEYRWAVEQLPFHPSHDYARGFTEEQAKHLLTVRKLPSRQRETALRDWVAVQAEVDAAKARLSNRQAVLQLVREELQGAVARFDEPRRTRIL